MTVPSPTDTLHTLFSSNLFNMIIGKLDLIVARDARHLEVNVRRTVGVYMLTYKISIKMVLLAVHIVKERVASRGGMLRLM